MIRFIIMEVYNEVLSNAVAFVGHVPRFNVGNQ